ncbi:MAG: hypothetical protein R2825_14570 [Saprospiraceae bacterium]
MPCTSVSNGTGCPQTVAQTVQLNDLGIEPTVQFPVPLADKRRFKVAFLSRGGWICIGPTWVWMVFEVWPFRRLAPPLDLLSF